jgi:hypothetical protein
VAVKSYIGRTPINQRSSILVRAAYPIIEQLEKRQLLSSVTWTGDGDGKSWNEASNWSSKAVPTSSNSVTIPTGDTPQLGTGTFAAQSLTLQGDAQINLQSATLFIDYATNPDPISTILGYLTTGAGRGWTTGGSAAAIVSSTVASDNVTPSLVYDVGYADGADGLGVAPSAKLKSCPRWPAIRHWMAP